MNTQTMEDVVNDNHYHEGFMAAEKRAKKRMKLVSGKISFALSTLLSAGQSEEDETSIELKKAIELLNNY